MTFLDLTVLLGGLAIFLHGLGLAREGLQVLAGEKLRTILFALSANRVVGLLSGAVVTTIVQSSEEIARTVLRHREKLVAIEAELREKHIARLNQGLRESLETSSMHLDLLAYLRMVNGHMGNLADAVVRRRERERVPQE